MLLLAFNVADRYSSFKFGTGTQRKTVVSVTFIRCINNTLLIQYYSSEDHSIEEKSGELKVQ